jgi:hypothetical protein
MKTIIRNRTIRPSSRKVNSAYRIKVENIKNEDEVVIFIDHESRDFREIYICTCEVFKNSDSIYFKVIEKDNKVNIIWVGEKHPVKIR